MTGQGQIDLLLKDLAILTMDAQRTFIKKGSIAVDNGVIIDIGTNLNYRAKKTIRVEQGVALPGLINCHMHGTLPRGICEDLELMEWLEKICYPLDAQYTPEIVEVAEELNQLEMIMSGTTTFVDIYRYMHAAAGVLERSGLRGFLTPQVIDVPKGVGETFENNVRLYHDWHGKGDGRINIWLGIHAPYSALPETYVKAKEFADSHGIGIHTHLCETRDEVEKCRREHSKSPVEYLHSLGVLGGRFLAAHCVHLTEADMEIMAENGVTAVYNPISNMKLASGTAPVVTMRDRGIRVVLATDSNLSNNNIDLLKEMQIAGALQKLANLDATVLKSHEILEMATVIPAQALGIDNEVGSIEKGKKADIIILDFDRPHLWPYMCNDRINNLIAHIVYSASGADVHSTIVDGKVLMEKRVVKTLDRKRIYKQAQEMLERLCRGAGLI